MPDENSDQIPLDNTIKSVESPNNPNLLSNLKQSFNYRYFITGLVVLVIIGAIGGYKFVAGRKAINNQITPTPQSFPSTQATDSPSPTFYLPLETPNEESIYNTTIIPLPTSTPVPPTNTPIPTTNTPIPPTNTPILPTPTPMPPSLSGVSGPYTNWSSPYSGSPGGVCLVINHDQLVNPNGGIVSWEFSWQLDNGDWSSWSLQHAIYCFGNITGSHNANVKPRINGNNEGPIYSKSFSI